MKTDIELAALSAEELIAVVHQLRQQLAEREQEIKRLTSLLVEKQSPPPPPLAPGPSQKPSEDMVEITSGSQEDLLAQLGKIYPNDS